jgi:hypothetical protein
MADPLGLPALPFPTCGRDWFIGAGAGLGGGGGTVGSTEGRDTAGFRLTLTLIPRVRLGLDPYEEPLFDDVLLVRPVVEPRRAIFYEALRSAGILTPVSRKLTHSQNFLVPLV